MKAEETKKNRDADYFKVEQLLEKNPTLGVQDACEAIGRPRKFFYNEKYRRKRDKASRTQMDLPLGKKEEAQKKVFVVRDHGVKVRKKSEAQLVTMSIPEKRKESVTIMMGDPDEIARILDKAKAVRN